MHYENYYTLNCIITIKYKGKNIKIRKEDFYMDGVLATTHYFSLEDSRIQYLQCVNCGVWITHDESEWVYCYDKRVNRFANTKACTKCYKTIKKEADTYLYHKKLAKGYLDELLFINTRSVINSDYETDSAFFSNYEYCYLTGIKCEGSYDKKTVHFDHFIAIDTGHVGRIIGNIYPIFYQLNLLKSNKNPFEWIKEKEICNRISQERWNKLVNYFAKCFGLTLDEYKNFVYWCYSQPRRIKDIENDGNTPSIDLWRKDKRKRKYLRLVENAKFWRS
ncbi:MAG: hypothetical protein PHD91_08385 [bacterium]|nr:hypothetical protein [bacterium]